MRHQMPLTMKPNSRSLMRIHSIASGSSGNCIIIDDGYSKLMLDAGISYRRIGKEVKLSEIAGVLITHDHNDHCQAVPELVKRGLRVIMSEGTRVSKSFDRVEICRHGEQIQVGSFDVLAFNVEHDVAEPLGFLCWSSKTNEKLLYLVDCKRVPVKFEGLTHVMVECNYIRSILDNRDIPPAAKYRIRNTHMGLEDVTAFLTETDRSKIREIHLMHLSNQSAEDDLLYKSITGKFGLPVIIH